MTPQQKMKDKLENIGLPYKKIDVYGRQIVITTWSRDAIDKWIPLLQKFVTKIRGTTECYDLAKVNKGSVLNQTHIKVYRVFARI